MFCAPAVDWEISAPPTTPRGTSRSGPGLTTLTIRVYRRHLDLKWRLRCRSVLDLKRGVLKAEALGEQQLKAAPELVTIVAGADDHVRRQRRKARGDLPHMQVMDLKHTWLAGQHLPDPLRVETCRRRFHEH